MVAAYAITNDPIMAYTADEWRQMAARTSLRSFTARMFSNYQISAHILTLVESLEWAASTPNARLIVTMPPRHSKSVHVSENFPAWYLGRNPDKRVIAASHTASLAYMFSRRVRNKIADPRYPFPGVGIAIDKGAVQAWDIENRYGGYHAVGVGGAPTGSGGDLIVIDDPIRSAADADSQIVRDALWEWYQGTLRTRLEPGGSIVVTACMVGDTSVTMADGTSKCLRDVRSGDRVATYENGSITTTRILNWINHGPDYIYEIRTKSGIIVRANKRHPFLIERGKAHEWRRLGDLKTGDTLVRVRCLKGRGGASFVPSTGANSRLGAKGIATFITAKRDGPTGTDRHLTTTNINETRNSNGGMASLRQSTTLCSQHKEGAAQFASALHPRRPERTQPTGKTDDSSSIIVTAPEKSEGCSATIAISPLGIAVPKNFSSAQPSTYEITPDEIVAIVAVGRADVFDIQVERTENFIADGVVSHNTRWHVDDLTGRLLAAQETGGEQWRHLHLPALSETDEALWPERWPVEALEKIRSAVGSRVWESQYQGRPAPAAGGTFKRDWWQFYRADDRPALLAFDQLIQSWDMTFRQTKAGSFVVGQVWGKLGANCYLLAQTRDRMDFPASLAAMRSMSERWPMSREKLVEDKANGPAVVAMLKDEIPGLIEVTPEGGKEARANAVSWMVEAGNVYLPDPIDAPWIESFLEEAAAFPYGANDDQVDAMTQALVRIGGLVSWSDDGGDLYDFFRAAGVG